METKIYVSQSQLWRQRSPNGSSLQNRTPSALKLFFYTAADYPVRKTNALCCVGDAPISQLSWAKTFIGGVNVLNGLGSVQ